jgi:hypothetical protein
MNIKMYLQSQYQRIMDYNWSIIIKLYLFNISVNRNQETIPGALSGLVILGYTKVKGR